MAEQLVRVYRGTRSEASGAYGAESPFLARDGWRQVGEEWRASTALMAAAVAFLVGLPVAWAVAGVAGVVPWFVVAGVVVAAIRDGGTLTVTLSRN
jgi:hypothetical protein